MKFLQAVWLPGSLAFLSSVLFLLCIALPWPYASIGCLVTGVSGTIFVLDLAGRMLDYDYLRDERLRARWRTRQTLLWERYSKTRCSRNVMVAVDPRAKSYYYMLGYRWYHFFPDGAFSKSSPFMTLSFWRSLCRPN